MIQRRACAAGDVSEWLKLSKTTVDTGKSLAADGMSDFGRMK